MKIFCIPGGGTPASVFFRWKGAMRKKAEIRILDYPDRDVSKSNNKLKSVSEIAQYLYDQIKDELTDRYFLLSSCTGCMIEYELYRLIEKNNLKLPEKFIVFSAFAPSSSFYSKKKYLSKENDKLIYGIYKSLFSNEIFSLSADSSMKCTDFLIKSNNSPLKKKISFPDVSILPEQSSFEKKSMLDFANKTISMILFDWNIAAKYSESDVHFSGINSDICVIRGNHDDVVSENMAKEWSKFTKKNFEYITIDGDHNVITNNPAKCIEFAGKMI